jgi:hypothetical protein
MKKCIALLGIGLSCAVAEALPTVGYYKSYYSADHGEFRCTRVLSNTKQVKLSGKKVTYFEMTNGDGAVLSCIPQIFADTDDTSVDGDIARVIFTSLSVAMCTSDGGVYTEVGFDNTHVFWGGESMGMIKLPDTGINALAKQKERQTNYMEYYSDSGCP